MNSPNVKRCRKCGKTLPLDTDHFYRHSGCADGYFNSCIPCTRKASTAHYRKHRPQYRAYFKHRDGTEARKACKSAYDKRSRARYPERVAARHAVEKALQSGALSKQPCAVCGGTPVEAHHEDYSKPLQVRWLCFKHHRAEHGQEAL